MKTKKALIPILTILILLFAMVPVYHAYAEKDTFRVAYIEGDPYLNYAGNLNGLVAGLADRGLTDPIDSLNFEEGSDDARLIWTWLKDHSAKEVEFVQDDFYQLINMSDEEKAAFVSRMNEDGDIDLILVMGTAAAKFLEENNVKTNMMIMSVTNAYASGIVEATEYSGIDNVWAHTSPNRYYNQLNVFYNLFHFEKLGIVYEDSENGKNEISYIDIQKFVKDKNIDLIEVPVAADQKLDGPLLYEQKMIAGYQELAGEADAVYMTNCGYRTPERIPKYLSPLYAKGIPVFSQTGKNDVVNGALITIYRSNFREIGNFCAGQFVRIMKGKAPGELKQEYDESQAICLNLAAANRAGLAIPFKVLLSADTIINSIGEGGKK